MMPALTMRCVELLERVGEAAAHAAWLLAQHAPSDFQEECLPLLEDAVAHGDTSPRDLAYSWTGSSCTGVSRRSMAPSTWSGTAG
jgi:hypothetical protein